MHHFTSMSQIICHAHLTHQGREKQTKPKSFDISPVVRCFYETNSPLALCIVSIQEQFLTKSGLQWRAYGRLKTQILNLIFPETNNGESHGFAHDQKQHVELQVSSMCVEPSRGAKLERMTSPMESASVNLPKVFLNEARSK